MHNIISCVGQIEAAMMRVCEQGQPAWGNFEGIKNACHMDSWLLLMAASVFEYSKQHKNDHGLNNDAGKQ